MTTTAGEYRSYLLDDANRKERRAEVIGRYAAGVIAVAFVVMIAMQTYLAFQLSGQVATTKRVTEAIAGQAVRNHAISVQVRRIVAQLRSCTTPDGRCYKEEVARAATQAGQINAITYLAVACADRPGLQTVTTIRLCVASKLDNGG